MSLRLIAALLLATIVRAQSPVHKRAVLIGINDYSASRLGPRHGNVPSRDWPNLSGAANDVAALREMLVLRQDFAPGGITTLTDQQATRAAILQTLDRLAKDAGKDDVVLVYFAGHGSQVANSKSDEPDRLDETIVPADSRLGARDIRDKELRPLFNRMLDRGARLTILLDNCHSGSGARGLPNGAQPRGIKPDPRDVADATDYGPRPSDRGALVITAAHDFDEAWETRAPDGTMHGAFTWAWMRAMRDAAPDESARDTFLRAQARVRNEKPFQDPAIEGDDAVQRAPFLGIRGDRHHDRTVIAVKSVRPDGTVLLLGGWAHGLTIGSQLQSPGARVVIAAIRGLGQSEARIVDGRAQALHSGSLLEVSGWAAPPAAPLRVWVPRFDGTVEALTALAKRSSATTRRAQRIADPVGITPSRVVLANDAGAMASIRNGEKVFVQFPAPSAMLDFAADGVELTTNRRDADYILAGRWTGSRLEYAWVRPLMNSSDAGKSGLPVRTKWLPPDSRGLRDALLRLRRIHAWLSLDSPPSPFHLTVGNGGTRLIGEQRYRLALKTTPRAPQRFVYVFVIDSEGRSTLLFPRNGSVENRFPIEVPAPQEIPIGEPFEVAPPYGIDTYFLLTSDEPLPDPSILEWDSVRAGGEPRTPLEQLLILTAAGTRARNIFVPAAWSLEKVVFESVSPTGR